MRLAAQRGAGLTRQLLAFSRRQALKPEPIDVASQIGGMRELLERSLRGDVKVTFDFQSDTWTVEVDPGELELVILNLTVNARDAMPDGGPIVVRTENRPMAEIDGLIGDFVIVSVTDTGTGMPPEIQARVFEPFFTTKDVGKGSGLGLAQAHGFATQSGGALRIESKVGIGTTILLYLPRSKKTPQHRNRLLDLHVEQPHPTHAGSVLLVEDDDEVAELVSQMLRQLGYDVIHARSPTAALGALANQRAIDLVFSDIMMPGGMNGVQLAREIRRRRADLPILLTSGYAQAAWQAAEAEGVRILPKPYRLEDLSVALEAIKGSK
jgi:CheY-like chemotaxis protein